MLIFSIWSALVIFVTIAECNGDLATTEPQQWNEDVTTTEPTEPEQSNGNVTTTEPQQCNAHVHGYLKDVARSLLQEEFLPDFNAKIAERDQKIDELDTELKVCITTTL